MKLTYRQKVGVFILHPLAQLIALTFLCAVAVLDTVLFFIMFPISVVINKNVTFRLLKRVIALYFENKYLKELTRNWERLHK